MGDISPPVILVHPENDREEERRDCKAAGRSRGPGFGAPGVQARPGFGDCRDCVDGCINLGVSGKRFKHDTVRL